MVSPKKQYQHYATLWADSFAGIGEGARQAVQGGGREPERAGDDERRERIERQRRLAETIRVKHADILRALADR